MTVRTAATFDLDALRRGYEEWDIETLSALYAEDVEVFQVDRDHPPSAPKVRTGKGPLLGMWEHCAGAGVKGGRQRDPRAPRRARHPRTLGRRQRRGLGTQ